MPYTIPYAHVHTDSHGHAISHAHVYAATHPYALALAHPVDTIADAGGDELEHGFPDYAGQFPEADAAADLDSGPV